MKPFETKITLRIYDTKLVEKINLILKANPNRYQSKNQLLIELLELGVKEKLKSFPTPPDTPASAANPVPAPETCNENSALLKQLKELIEDMHAYNKHHVEGLLAHLKTSERMSAAIYNMVLAIIKDEPITPAQVEVGYFDEVPDRFLEFLAELLDELISAAEEEDDEGADDELPN